MSQRIWLLLSRFPYYSSSPLSSRQQPFLPRLSSSHHNNTSCGNCSTTTSSSSSSSSSRRGGKRKMSSSGNSSRRWWKRVLSQRFNAEGVVTFAGVATRERELALPHISVPDIRWIDWGELARLGFRGVVFDKDNTLTAPYSLSLWPPLSDAFLRCKSTFPGKIAVFSNSAGLYQYDPDGSEASALEDSIGGIHVIRHGTKKPAGTAVEIEKYFGCSASLLILVGDRHFTDVVYGNRNGFLTILTEPLSLYEEPFIVRQVRKLEGCLVNCWHRKGLKPANHSLLLDTKQCVKVPSL